MELLFRNYLSLDRELAFLVLAAWLVARTGNTFVAPALQPTGDATKSSASASDRLPATRVGTESSSPEQAARFLGVELPSRVPAAAAEATPSDPHAEPVKSSLRATLIGPAPRGAGTAR